MHSQDIYRSYEIYGRESGTNYGTYDCCMRHGLVIIDTTAWDKITAASDGEELRAYVNEHGSYGYYGVAPESWK